MRAELKRLHSPDIAGPLEKFAPSNDRCFGLFVQVMAGPEGVSINTSVEARDPFNNRAVDFSGVVSFDSSDSLASSRACSSVSATWPGE